MTSKENAAKPSELTLQHYDQHADDFWAGTRGHDVSQNIGALLEYIELIHYYRPPGLPREQQPWLASVWRANAGEAPLSS